MDFFFLGARSDTEQAVAITLTCCTTSATSATGLPGKLKGSFVVDWAVNSIDEWGYLDVILRADQEPAVRSIAEEVKRRRAARGTEGEGAEAGT